MNQIDSLITTASWERRFETGTEKVIQTYRPRQILMFYYSEYIEWTRSSQESLKALCDQSQIIFIPVEISFANPVESWNEINSQIGGFQGDSQNVLVDITTMPRETIWTIFFLLRTTAAKIQYIYHQPVKYNTDWLSRDPGRPRLVFKLSGVASLGKPTALVITTGFDPERTRQLMRFFEPRTVFLGIQTGDQFDNQSQNAEWHHKELQSEYQEFTVNEFDIDAYTSDHGGEAVRQIIASSNEKYNMIMSSLGPKLTSVSLFRVHEEFPETALAYAPSGDFNRNYSTGIKESISGDL